LNPALIFLILEHNSSDLLAIEHLIGGLSGIIKLVGPLKAIEASYQAGGAEFVLAKNGADVQLIIETIGPANIAAAMPRAAAILKTVQGATSK
jgi:hypothetical protein